MSRIAPISAGPLSRMTTALLDSRGSDGRGRMLIACPSSREPVARELDDRPLHARDHRDQVVEAGAALDARLVHVERAVDLDLEGVAAGLGPAVVPGGEAAGIGLVAPDREALPLERGRGRLHD